MVETEAYVFGTEKFRLIRGLKIPYRTIYPPPPNCPYQLSEHAVELFNEKTGRWQIYPCNVTIVECPVCGQPLKAYYIPGTTWIAFCSKECAEKFDKKVKELGSITKAIAFFRKKEVEEYGKGTREDGHI